MKRTASCLSLLLFTWLVYGTAWHLDQITRELVTRGLLAHLLGAPVDGWRLTITALTIESRIVSLSNSFQNLFFALSALLPIATSIIFLVIATRLKRLSCSLLTLYWSLVSLFTVFRPLIFPLLMGRLSFAGFWRGSYLASSTREIIGGLLTAIGLCLFTLIIRRLVFLSSRGLPVNRFSHRYVITFLLVSLPLAATTMTWLWPFRYFRSGNETPFIIAWMIAFATMPALAVIKRVGDSESSLLARDTPVLPANIELARGAEVHHDAPRTKVPDEFVLLRSSNWTCFQLKLSELVIVISIAALLILAVPLSVRLQRWTLRTSLSTVVTGPIRIYYPPDKLSESKVKAYSEFAAFTFFRIQKLLGPEKSLNTIEFEFYASAEEKQSRVGDGETVSLDTANRSVQILFMPPLDHFDPLPIARLLLRQRFGRSDKFSLESGLERFLTRTENSQDRLQRERELAEVLEIEGPMSIEQLLFPEHPESLSPFVIGPLAEEFAAFVQENYGMAKLLNLYGRELSSQSIDNEVAETLFVSYLQLQKEWNYHIQQCAHFFSNSPIRRHEQQNSSSPILFQKGMSFSAEGASHTGYISQAAQSSLDQLKVMNVEWISLMPFAFSAWENGGKEVSFSHRGLWESDDSLRKIAYEAKMRGISIFLKPHLWLGRLSTVELQIPNVLDWKTWFSSYSRYILHQARLGEEIGASLFSIGNELPYLSLDPAHEADWRQLISNVRKVYSGSLTYCANWGDEFETIRFADALDVIGLNAYYPLITDEQPSEENLMKGAKTLVERIDQVARRQNRPVLITEIGYPSLASAARKPWLEDPSSETSLEVQAKAAETFFAAIWGKPWFRGVYWWKWYSHGSGGGENDRSYMPRGKPVARIISKWYSLQHD